MWEALADAADEMGMSQKASEFKARADPPLSSKCPSMRHDAQRFDPSGVFN
jgi:hypothetical protein